MMIDQHLLAGALVIVIGILAFLFIGTLLVIVFQVFWLLIGLLSNLTDRWIK